MIYFHLGIMECNKCHINPLPRQPFRNFFVIKTNTLSHNRLDLIQKFTMNFCLYLIRVNCNQLDDCIAI